MAHTDVRARGVVVAAALALVLGGCSAPSGDPGKEASAASSMPTAGATAHTCPNPEGQRCIGELAPGAQYTTTVFQPRLTYAVPADGWFNEEDTPGNFLLLPPGQSLEGANAGTSDYIGVYTSIEPARFENADGCVIGPVPGIAPTPQAIVEWMSAQPELTVTAPSAVTVGGLRGLRTDVRVRDGATLPTCMDPQSHEKVTVFLLYTGVAPSSLDHGVIPGMTMRLYLLEHHYGTLAIEISDIDSAPATADELTAVAERFSFGP